MIQRSPRVSRPSQSLIGTSLLLSLSLLLSGCGGGESSTESTSTKTGTAKTAESTPSADLKKHPEAGEALAAEQVLVRGNGSEPASLDPQIVEDAVSGNIVRDLFEGLTNSGPKGEVVPGVAESWSASDDNLVWTFKLRKDAKWSDGSPVTANDFVYAWQRAVDPAVGSHYAYYLEAAGIKNAKEITEGKVEPETLGVRAVDDYTFEVNLHAPIPYLPDMATHYTMFPSPKQAVEAHGSDWTKPGKMVSNGAYQLESWSVGEKLEAIRNPHYWDNENTIIDKVVYLPIEDVTAELQRFESGELMFTSTVPASQMDRLKRERAEELTISPYIGTYMYQFNTKKPPFDDVRVRKALTYAIDRDIIVNHITKAGQTPAYSLVPSFVNGFDFVQPEYGTWTQEKRDAEAVKLLKEAGFSKEKPLEVEILYNTNDDHKIIAVAIGQMWKEKLGAETTASNMEWKTFLSEKHAGNFAVGRYGWIGDYNEASTFLSLLTTNSGNNDGKWGSPEYDKLLDDARKLKDPNPLYAKAEEILWKDFPVAPVYFYTHNSMINTRLRGYAEENPQNMLYAKDMYITAE